jgi:hypothetical protein
MPGDSGGPVVTTLVWFYLNLHARLRVHRAPGIPHALWGGRYKYNSGAMRRGNAELSLNVIARSDSDEAIQLSSFRGDAEHRTRNLEIPGLVLRTIPE